MGSAAVRWSDVAVDEFVNVRADAQHGPRRVLGTNPAVQVERAPVQSIGRPAKRPHDGEVDDGVGAGILRGADHVWRRLIAVDWRARAAGSRVDGCDDLGGAFERGNQRCVVLGIGVADVLNINDVVQISRVAIVSNHRPDLSPSTQGFLHHFNAGSAVRTHHNKHAHRSLQTG